MGDTKATITEWTEINKEWTASIDDARQKVDDAKVSVDQFALSGDTTSKAYLQAKDVLKGATDAVTTLQDEQAKALDPYRVRVADLQAQLTGIGAGGGGVNGISPATALTKDTSAADAAFTQGTNVALPDQFQWMGNNKQTIQEWDIVNKEWDQTIQIVKQHELDAKVAVDDLRLAGDNSSQAFINAQAAVQGYTDAEQVLNDKRAQALDQYTSQIEDLKVALENSRQVVKALVIDLQGPSTAAGRMQIAMGAGQGTNVETSNQPITINLNNRGIITTNDQVDWLSQTLMAVQRRGRTQLAGT